jgi:hypothetical protein
LRHGQASEQFPNPEQTDVNSDWTEDKLEAAEVGTEEVVVVEQLSSDQSAEN